MSGCVTAACCSYGLIRTLARVAIESEDTAVMKRDLEMILTIVGKALPSGPENPSEAIFGA